MFYLLVQTFIWLILAAALGLVIGWLIWGRGGGGGDDSAALRAELERCRRKCAELEGGQAPDSADKGAGPQAVMLSVESAEDQPDDNVDDKNRETADRPTFLDEPDGEPDDLKQISGVGKVLEKTLNDLGIFHFRQIAEFDRDTIDWVDNYLSFSGRIEREDWVGQAQKLAAGESTDFSERYKGTGR